MEMDIVLVILVALGDLLLMIIAFRLGAVLDRLPQSQGGIEAKARGE